jgi:dihydrofolate reductase
MPLPRDIPARNASMTVRDDNTPHLALIAAVAKNGVIGARNGLPWRLPADLAHFRAHTMGHAVIMGRRTWESLGRALPGRQNIVVTRRQDCRPIDAETAATLDDAITLVSRPPPAFCIGGGELFRVALAKADTLYLTEIDRDFDGDTTFPATDPSLWREIARETHHVDGTDGFDYAFVTYRRSAG